MCSIDDGPDGVFDFGQEDADTLAAAVRAAFEELQAMQIIDHAERHGVSAEEVVRMAESAAMRNKSWTPRPSFTIAEHDECAFWCRWENMRLEVEAQDSFVLRYPDGKSSVTLRLVERDGRRVVEYVDGGETLGMWDTLDEALDNVPLFRRGETTKNKKERRGMKPIWTFDDDDLDTIKAWVDGRGLESFGGDDGDEVEISEPTVNGVLGERIAEISILQDEDPARCEFRFDLFGTADDEAVRIESSDLNNVLARAGEKLDERMKRRQPEPAGDEPAQPAYYDDRLRWWCANLQQKQMEPADGGWLLYPEETYGYSGVDSVDTGVHMAVPRGHIALVVSRTGQTRIVTPQCREAVSVFVGVDGVRVDVSPARPVARVFLLPVAAPQAVEADRREEVDP